MRFMLIAVFLACAAASAKTSVPQDKIPASLAPEVRQEIDKLYSNTTDVVAGARKLGEMGDRAAPAIPFLIGLFSEGSYLECVREDDRQFCGFGLEMSAASLALAAIGKPALPPMVELARKGDEGTAGGAITALAHMQNPEAVSVLIGLARNPAYPRRSQVASELGYARGAQVGDVLVTLAKDATPEIRSGALKGLARSQDPRGADLRIAGLHDADAKVRETAAFTLVTHPEPRAFDALLTALADSSDGVRNGACQALGELKDRRAVKPLIDVVSADKESLVRFQAGRALESIVGLKLGDDGAKWRAWFENKGQ